MGLKEELKARNKMPVRSVIVPELDGLEVFIRTMKGSERDAFEAKIHKHGAGSVPDNFRAKLLVLCLSDENGNRLFSDLEENQVGELNAKVANDLFDLAMQHNGMKTSDVEDAKKN